MLHVGHHKSVLKMDVIKICLNVWDCFQDGPTAVLPANFIGFAVFMG